MTYDYVKNFIEFANDKLYFYILLILIRKYIFFFLN